MRKSEICKNLEAALKRLALEDFIHWLKSWNTLKYASFYSRKKRIKNYHSIKIPQKSPDIVTNVFTGHLAMNQNNTVTPQYHIYSIQSRTFTEVYFLQYLQTIQFNLSRFLTLSLKTLQAVKPACQKWDITYALKVNIHNDSFWFDIFKAYLLFFVSCIQPVHITGLTRYACTYLFTKINFKKHRANSIRKKRTRLLWSFFMASMLYLPVVELLVLKHN